MGFNEDKQGGFVEELWIHEAAHTSVDAEVYGTNEWNEAVALDDNFISTYAQDYWWREDVAESLLPWLALKKFRSRLQTQDVTTIEQTIPNRLEFFDNKFKDSETDWYPISGEPSGTKYTVPVL